MPQGIKRRNGKRGVTYQATIELAPAADGTRRQKRRSFKRQADAIDWRQKQLHDLREGTYVEPSRMPFAEYLDHWLATHDAGESSMLRYASVIRTIIAPALGDIPLGSLKGIDIQTLYNEESARVTRPEQVKIIVNMALNHAVDAGLIPRNPAARLRMPKRQRQQAREQVKVWTAAEVKVILEATREEPDGPLWWLALHTGLRPGELVALRWQDLDLDGRSLRVAQNQTQNRHGEQTFGYPKSSASRRTIGIDLETVRVLRVHKVAQNDLRLQLGRDWQDHDLVFARDRITRRVHVMGMAQNAGSVAARFGLRIKRLDVPLLTFYCCRHSHASLLLAAGRPIDYVSRRLGHANVSMTWDYYSHLVPGTEHLDADVFAAIIRDA